MKKFLPLLWLAFGLVACSSSPAPSPSPLNTATVAVQPSPTTAPSSTPLAQASAPPRPTVRPTATRIPTTTPRPTSTPTIDPCARIFCSPDGQYIAKLHHADEQMPVDRIEISARDDGTLIATIPSQLEPTTVDPHPSVNIYGWSKDSTQLYFYYHNFPDGGDYAFWWDGFNLQSFNVVTGESQPVLPSTDWVSFAFSPDETRIAYAPAGTTVYLRTLATGAEQLVNVPIALEKYARLGNFHWAPSGHGLAFQAEIENTWVQTYYLHSTTLQLHFLKESRLLEASFGGWTDEGNIFFTDGTVIFISPTGEIGTPTP